MTLKEALSNDAYYRDVPGADILDECYEAAQPAPVALIPLKSARSPRARRAANSNRSATYMPTAKEAAAAGRMLERRKAAKPAITFAVDHSDGSNKITEVHPDKVIAQVALADTFATANGNVSQALLLQIAGISVPMGGGNVQADRLTQGVALVQGIAPRDELEAMLATQMVAIHNAAMTSASALQTAQTLPQQEAATGMAVKFAKTFAAQIEALKTYRSSGEQHVHVHRHTYRHDGAAADNQGGGRKNSAAQSHEPDAPSQIDERSSPLLRKIEALAAAVPSAGAQG